MRSKRRAAEGAESRLPPVDAMVMGTRFATGKSAAEPAVLQARRGVTDGFSGKEELPDGRGGFSEKEN